jgi:hypothetical protein
MGLWDLDSDLNRQRTGLVDRYRELAIAGASAVGRLEEVQHVS